MARHSNNVLPARLRSRKKIAADSADDILHGILTPLLRQSVRLIAEAIVILL